LSPYPAILDMATYMSLNKLLGVKIEQRTPSTSAVTVRSRWLRIMDLNACAETLSAHCRFSALLPLHWGRTRQRGQAMDVFEAVNSRIACRQFLDKPVDHRPYRRERAIVGNNEVTCAVLHFCTGTLPT
jgi:hypothetical protein